jgi:pentatricopeptide repeat protein
VLQVGFAPNAVSFNAVINRCARAGDVLSAERWLNLMQDAGAVPSQLTFNSIIQAYVIPSLWDSVQGSSQSTTDAFTFGGGLRVTVQVHTCSRSNRSCSLV